MANKMVSQLLLVALAVPQVICTNTSQSDYASFDEHVQKDCFKGGKLPSYYSDTGMDLEANPASACKTCSGSSYRECLTCDKGSTLWFVERDCAGICASDPTGPTVGEGNLFGALKLSNVAWTRRRRKPLGAYEHLGKHWSELKGCGMSDFKLICEPKDCKNVPSAYYYPADSKDPYEHCKGNFDSEEDGCGIRKYSKGMPAILTRATRRRRGGADGGSPDSSENDNDDNDSPDSSEKSSESGSGGGGGGCSNKKVKFASEQITCKKAQASGYCDKQNSDRRRADGTRMASECEGCCGGGSGTSSDSDSLFEVAQEKDESVGTARPKEGLMRRTRGKAETATAIDAAADIRLPQS